MAEKTTSPIRSDNPFHKALSMAEQSDARGTRRRTFLTAAAAAALGPTAAGLLGGPLASMASAANASNLPDFAPVPTEAFGPALNADGYFVGQIDGNLYWVTDSVYQAMFLTTREGVVLVDAPPTIGHNLLRAIASVTHARGMPSKVTHLVTLIRTRTTLERPRCSVWMWCASDIARIGVCCSATTIRTVHHRT